MAGGARVTCMEIGERGADGGTADDVTGQGLAEEERQRRKALEARLSRLVAAERTGEKRINTPAAKSESLVAVRVSSTYIP